MLRLTFFDLDALDKGEDLPVETYANVAELQKSDRLVEWTKKKFDDQEFSGFGLCTLGARMNLTAHYGVPNSRDGTFTSKIVAFVNDAESANLLKQLFDLKGE